MVGVMFPGALGLPTLNSGDPSLHTYSTEYRIIPEQWEPILKEWKIIARALNEINRNEKYTNRLKQRIS